MPATYATQKLAARHPSSVFKIAKVLAILKPPSPRGKAFWELSCRSKKVPPPAGNHRSTLEKACDICDTKACRPASLIRLQNCQGVGNFESTFPPGEGFWGVLRNAPAGAVLREKALRTVVCAGPYRGITDCHGPAALAMTGGQCRGDHRSSAARSVTVNGGRAMLAPTISFRIFKPQVYCFGWGDLVWWYADHQRFFLYSVPFYWTEYLLYCHYPAQNIYFSQKSCSGGMKYGKRKEEQIRRIPPALPV